MSKKSTAPETDTLPGTLYYLGGDPHPAIPGIFKQLSRMIFRDLDRTGRSWEALSAALEMSEAELCGHLACRDTWSLSDLLKLADWFGMKPSDLIERAELEPVGDAR